MSKNKPVNLKNQSRKEIIMLHVNKKRLVKLFCKLVKIKSPSGEENEMAKNVIERLRKIGISASRDNYGNVIAKISGFGKPLILCGHLDTAAVGSGKQINPTPAMIGGQNVIKSDGTTILGADDKDFVATIIEALTIIKEENISHRALEIIFTVEEEEISKGAKELNFSLLKGKECLISDSSDPYGTITLSAPYCEKFNVAIKGKKAHTKEPEKGINAIAIAVKIISSLPLGRVSKFVTMNIGFIVGGLKDRLEDNNKSVNLENIFDQACNSVPDIVKFCGEIRGPNKDEFERASKEIKSILGGYQDKRIEVDIERLADGYVHLKEDLFVKQIVDLFEDQKIKPVFINSTGGSDANVFNANGIKTVEISSARRNIHQTSEYLIVDDLVRLTDFIVRLVISK